MSDLKGERVNTFFPGDCVLPGDGRHGTVIDGGGPWQVRVQWDDGSVSDIHTEDVVFG